MKYVFFICWIILPAIGLGQIVHLKKKEVPATMKYTGEFRDAVQFQDKEGIHVVITTEDQTSTPADDDESVYTGHLHAFCYLKSANGVQLSWQLTDAAGPCGADVDASFRAGSLAVTDLDHNGIDEVWLIYRVSCGGYQKPSPMKLIMHEGDKKFAMRGTTRLKLLVKPVQYKGGDYTFDENFTAGPGAFRDYANALWVQNREETATY